VQKAGGDASEQRLYELIWKRTIASQMSDAELERTKVTIVTKSTSEHFIATGEIIKFDGFLKVYLESTDDDESDDESGLLPKMNVGDALTTENITATERFTRPPARYTEASLVKQLEELGIGRPSTYAPTITTVQKRGYVERKDVEGHERQFVHFTLKNGALKREVKKETFGADRNKLLPTDIGGIVNDFLVEHFKTIMDYNFTASVEKEFDYIAQGMIEWTKMISKFYDPFHKNINDTTENSDRATGERELGIDPKSGRPIIARIGRFGAMIQIGKQDDEVKPLFASLQKTQSINTITLEEALDLFKLPKDLGIYDGQPISVNVGRFGPYVRFANSFVSIPKDKDPLEITLEEAKELIDAKKLEDASKNVAEYEHEGNTIQVLNGKYGVYIKMGKNNYKIPKGTQNAELTKEKCIEIMNNQPAPSARSFKGKKK
jgi:DNA topoisomerase-1